MEFTIWIFISPVIASILFLNIWIISKRYPVFKGKEKSDWRDFEIFVSQYMRKHGYNKVKLGVGTSDGGRDVIGRKNGKKRVVQCKLYQGSVGVRYIREIAGVALKMRGKPVLATTGSLTKTAKQEAKQLGVVVWKFE